jgi:WD40 repeat protein
MERNRAGRVSGTKRRESGVIQLCEVLDRRVLRLTGHSAEVQSLAFSSDGRTLVSGARDSTIRLWHVATGRAMGILYETLPHSLTDIRALFFSEDGNQLYAATLSHRRTGGVFLWSTQLAEK